MQQLTIASLKTLSVKTQGMQFIPAVASVAHIAATSDTLAAQPIDNNKCD